MFNTITDIVSLLVGTGRGQTSLRLNIFLNYYNHTKNTR